jgi:Protein of unknown function (DUF1236)
VGPAYRYAIVNDRPVIVEPRSRRIVEIIEYLILTPCAPSRGEPEHRYSRAAFGPLFPSQITVDSLREIGALDLQL